MAERLSLFVVTGFLGSGKTTLLQRLLKEDDSEGTGIVINEFGEVGLDHTLLVHAEERIELVEGGCICCARRSDIGRSIYDLVAKARKDGEGKLDRLVIETSGLALPQPLVRAFTWPSVRHRVTIDGVVTVVDAAAVAEGRFAHDEAAVAAQRAADPSLDHDDPIEELFEDQLSCADLVVLSKADLVGEAALAEVEAIVRRESRSEARSVRATLSGVSAEILLGLGMAVAVLSGGFGRKRGRQQQRRAQARRHRGAHLGVLHVFGVRHFFCSFQRPRMRSISADA